jgi:hypothetical protein
MPLKQLVQDYPVEDASRAQAEKYAGGDGKGEAGLWEGPTAWISPCPHTLGETSSS